MASIEGVVAHASVHDDRTVLTVFPIATTPERRLNPDRAVELVLVREPWQSQEGHRDHAHHMVGRGGVIEYGEDAVIASIRGLAA